jgi:hypothetical protein
METPYREQQPQGGAQRPVSPVKATFTRRVQDLGKVVYLVALGGVWLVVGTPFWVWLLARALGGFSIALVASQFSQQNMPSIEARLDYVCGFLFRGFRQLYNSIFLGVENEQVMQLSIPRLALESFGTLVFLFLVLLVEAPQRLENAIPPLGKLAGEVSGFVTGLAPAASVLLYFGVGVLGYLVGAVIFRDNAKSIGDRNEH